MNVIVALMVVAVVLSSTLEDSQARDGDITNEELCEQLKSNERRVLTMGARGRSQEDAHFYILMEGGYMFKVPLANLHVDAKNRTTSITIDQNFLRADVYFNVSPDIFSRDNLFFLISNRDKDAFLGRIISYQEQSTTAFQLFDLSGARTIRDNLQGVLLQYCALINVMGSSGIDSYSTYGFELSDKKLYRMYIFEENQKDELKLTEGIGWFRYIMDMSSNTKLATVFYHKENPNKAAGYYYFLDADGIITVTRREDATKYIHDEWYDLRSVSSLYSDRFEVKLSSFVVCDYQTAKSDSQRPQSSPNATTNTTAQTGSSTIYWAIPLGIGAILVMGGIALYWIKRPQRKKNKNNKKNKPRDDSVLSSLGTSNISSNLNTSNDSSCAGSSISTFTLVSNPNSTSSLASSASSALQSVKSKIVSLLEGNKSKQAKAVKKEKNSKVKPKSKAKSPKSP